MIILIIIAGLTAATVFLALGSDEKSRRIEELNSDKSALQALNNFNSGDSSEILIILKNLGIDSKDLVNTMYQSEKEAFGDIIDALESTDTSANADGVNDNEDKNPDKSTPQPNNGGNEEKPVPPEPDEPAEPAEPESPYLALFPHLYADITPPESYMDDSGYIYLTFDDGPSRHTTDILRYLDKYNVKATFFVGAFDDNNVNYRHLLNTILDSGHEIGVHTMTHVYRDIYASVEAYLDDFNQAFNLIYEQTGYKPYLFRFPGGSKNDFNTHIYKDIIEEMTRRGFVYYDWNVDSRDADDANWTTMMDLVINGVSGKNRSVVLFHDRHGGANTVYVMDDILKSLTADARGYTFSIIRPETEPVQF
ncbi:MAG: polysaccharide deacetylase [Oscillospiraceae bacterium]|nr:polysaccharide deacetylase [Oscillospiraceae bacterium]